MLYVDNESGGDLLATITVFTYSGAKLLEVNNTARQQKTGIDMSGLPGGMNFVETRRKSGKVGYLKVLKVR